MLAMHPVDSASPRWPSPSRNANSQLSNRLIAIAAKLTGSASGQTVLDPRFGDGGSTLVTWPRPAGCGGPAVLALTRFTFWRGALAVASVVDSSCSSDPDFDYAVFRLDAPLFRDGFDARLPL